MDAMYADKGDIKKPREIIPGHFWVEPQMQYMSLHQALGWVGDPHTDVDGSRFWYAPQGYVGIAKIGASWVLHQTETGQMTHTNNNASALDVLGLLTSVLYP